MRPTHTTVAYQTRFWKKVGAPNERGCREWLACRDGDGYGVVSHPSSKHNRRATHVALELHDGLPVLPGTVVMHSCDNPSCVEPTHLKRGTAAENTSDMIAKKRNSRGDRHWSKLRPELTLRGAKNPCAKLTAPQVLEIRERAVSGQHPAKIAADYGVTRQCVLLIVNRTNWKHL